MQHDCRIILASLWILCSIIYGGTSLAHPRHRTFDNSCSTSIGAMSFGNYNPLSTRNTTAQTTIEIACKENVALTISLSAGQSGSYASRSMIGPQGAHLYYNLYTRNPGQEIWGDGTVKTVTHFHHYKCYLRKKIFGILPAGQNNIPAGYYKDTIVATVAY